MINTYNQNTYRCINALLRVAPGGMVWGLLATGLLIVSARAEAPAHTQGTFIPAGELARRIALSFDRLTGPGFPEYTPNFVLADVELKPSYERLYQNFSGDVSGRYLDALSRRHPRGAIVRWIRCYLAFCTLSAMTAGSDARTLIFRPRRSTPSTWPCSGATAGCSPACWRGTRQSPSPRSWARPGDLVNSCCASGPSAPARRWRSVSKAWEPKV